jgi:hypothetical protein
MDMHRFSAFTISTLLACTLTITTAQTLRTGGWPLGAMPTEAEQQDSATARAYAEALQDWLDANPGVTLEAIEFSVWDQQALVTSIAGGIAPSYYPGQVLGGWNPAVMRAAFRQGLAADVTELVDRYNLIEVLPEAAQEVYLREAVDGRLYGLPTDFSISQGVYYRRDLVADLGLEEPQPDWTWDDFLDLAAAFTSDTRVGAMVQDWIPWEEAVANGAGPMTQLPAPETSWNWRWDFTSHLDRFGPILEKWRSAVYDDEIVQLSENMSDNERASAFINGATGMWIATPHWYTRPPTNEFAMSRLAEREGRPIDEVVGWLPVPRGALDTIPTQGPIVFLVSLDPDLSNEALDKAVSLFEHMVYGQGLIAQKQAVWGETEDLRYVYTNPFGEAQLPGIPGSMIDAWGETFMASVAAAAEIPLPPSSALFIPAEDAPGPGNQAWDDAYNRVMYSETDIDIAAEFARAEAIINQQAASFTSTVDDEVFIAGAQAYYQEMMAFYQQHSPQFYAEVLVPWFNETIVPALELAILP